MTDHPNAAAPLGARAAELRRLHHEDTPLVLPNAWDVPSARVLATHPRCRAVGTSSAGISATRGYAEIGYPAGESIPRAEMLEEISRITAAADLPVTADLESGYGDTPGDVAATITAAVTAGAVGANLEDAACDGGLFALDEAADRIRAARDAAEAAGVGMVINARTDTYWRRIGEPEDRFERTIERLRAYLAAGADCAFAPGLTDPETIAALVAGLGGPLNVLAQPGTPPVAQLRELGVARLSVGSGPARAAVTHTQALAAELFEAGTYSAIDAALPYTELADLLQS